MRDAHRVQTLRRDDPLKGQPTPLIELLATALAIAPAGRPSPAQLAESLGKCVPLLDKDRGPESSPRLAVVRPPSQSQRRQPRPFGPRDETEAAQERAQFQKRAFTPTGPSSPLAAVFTPGRLARIGGITVASLLVAWFLTSMALSREPHYYAKSIVFILLYAVAEVGIGAYLLFMETTSETEPGTRVEIRNEMGMAVRTEYTEGSGEAGSSRMSPGSKLVIHVRDETVVTMFDASSNAVVRSELIRGPATIVLPKSGSPRG
ncbi:MAG: hypothetical protein HY815_29885 [Candidatus Riflebacteria bacterium]|nr:hypothetical protein [Candidatus Riflebacteria bacterium]